MLVYGSRCADLNEPALRFSAAERACTRPTPSACRRRGSFVGSLRFIICQERRYDRSVIEPFKGSTRLPVDKSRQRNGDRAFRDYSTVRSLLLASMISRGWQIKREREREEVGFSATISAEVNIVAGRGAFSEVGLCGGCRRGETRQVGRKPNEGAGGSYVKKMKSLVLEQWAMTCAPGSIHVLLPVTRRLIDSQPSCSVNVVYRVSSSAGRRSLGLCRLCRLCRRRLGEDAPASPRRRSCIVRRRRNDPRKVVKHTGTLARANFNADREREKERERGREPSSCHDRFKIRRRFVAPVTTFSLNLHRREIFTFRVIFNGVS